MSICEITPVRVVEKIVEKIVEVPSVTDPKLVRLDELECCVCQGNNYLVKTNCHHFVCLECFCNLQKAECPLTRIPFENVPDKIKIIVPWYQVPETVMYESSPNASDEDEDSSQV